MSNTYFQFQQFRIEQKRSGMKVTTDACLFGAWVAKELSLRNPKTVLDIGTGTGLLSLMLAQQVSAKIDAVEVHQAAFEEAKSNIQNSVFKDKISLHFGPIQQYQPDKKYDAIICNPPFFSNSQKGQSDSKNQALHTESLNTIELIAAVNNLLSPDGTLYLLFPEREMNLFISQARKDGLHPYKTIVVQNNQESPAFRLMSAFHFKNSELTTEQLIIRRADGKYTDTFWQLLKEYYLPYNDPSLIN